MLQLCIIYIAKKYSLFIFYYFCIECMLLLNCLNKYWLNDWLTKWTELNSNGWLIENKAFCDYFVRKSVAVLKRYSWSRDSRRSQRLTVLVMDRSMMTMNSGTCPARIQVMERGRRYWKRIEPPPYNRCAEQPNTMSVGSSQRIAFFYCAVKFHRCDWPAAVRLAFDKYLNPIIL